MKDFRPEYKMALFVAAREKSDEEYEELLKEAYRDIGIKPVLSLSSVRRPFIVELAVTLESSYFDKGEWLMCEFLEISGRLRVYRPDEYYEEYYGFDFLENLKNVESIPT